MPSNSNLSIALFMVAVTLGCLSFAVEEGIEAPSDSVAVAQLQGLKPPSELALLMREMVIFSDTTKARIQRGADLPPFPAHFTRMHTATPTGGKLDMDPATYTAFADHYITQVRALYDAKATDREKIFNGTLNGCANCHTVTCPGPMQKIKKLYVPVL